jgi:hypothetical protein
MPRGRKRKQPDYNSEEMVKVLYVRGKPPEIVEGDVDNSRVAGEIKIKTRKSFESYRKAWHRMRETIVEVLRRKTVNQKGIMKTSMLALQQVV